MTLTQRVLPIVLLGLGFAGDRPLAQQAPPAATGFISGQVVDGRSTRPVPGATVTLFHLFDNPRVHEAIADGLGRFVFSGVPAGEFRLMASRPGWRDAAFLDGSANADLANVDSGLVTLRPGERTRVTLSLWRNAIVSGRVSDERGEPMAGVAIWPRQWVISRGHRRLGGNATVVRTDDRGEFTVALEPGSWVVGTHVAIVTQDDGKRRRVSYGETFFPQSPTADGAAVLTLQAGEERQGIDIQLRTGSAVRVSGVLTRSNVVGEMPSRVELLSTADGSLLRLSEVEAQDRFTFEDVPAGSYVVRSQTFGGQDPLQPHVLWANAAVEVVDRDLDLSVNLHAPVLVSGRVVFDGSSPQSRDAMRGSVGLWLYRDDQLPRSYDYWPFVPVGTDGRFSLMTPPGRYVIVSAFIPSDAAMTIPRGQERWAIRSATYAGLDVADRPLDISRNVDDVVVTLTDRRTALRGRVTGRWGGTLVVFPADETLWADLPTGRRFYVTPIRRDRSFEVTALPEGDYLVAALRVSSTALHNEVFGAAFLKAVSVNAKQVRLLDDQPRTVELDLVPAPAVDALRAPLPKPLQVSERADVRVLPTSSPAQRDGRVQSERDDKGAIVRGTIVDEHGLPLPDALVHIRAYPTGPNGHERPPSAHPDGFPYIVKAGARGEYRAFGIAPGEYIIHAEPPEESNSPMIITQQADLDAAARSSGSRVAAPPRRASGMYGPLFYPDTIHSSQAQVVKLAAGAEHVADFRFRMSRTGTLSGWVRGAARASLQLFPSDEAIHFLTRSAETDSSGAFHIPGVAPGEYRLVATGSASPGVELTASVELFVDGDHTGTVLDLQPQSTVLVRLTGNAEGEARRLGGAMSLIPVGPGSLGRRYVAPITTAGNFSISDVAAGRYRFELPVSMTRSGLRIASQLVNGVDTMVDGLEVRSGADLEVQVEIGR